MADLLDALSDPDFPLLRYALLAALLASIPSGIIGTYVVVRRISYIAGAISHCVLSGVGAAIYLQVVFGLSWFHTTYGAVAASLGAAVVIGLVSLYARQREDTVIGAVWAVGMAVGLLLFHKTPGYENPMSHLFGNILLTTKEDLWLMLGLDVLVVVLGGAFHNKLVAVCFDEEFAQLRGVPAKLYYLLLLCLTALTVVLLTKVVGIVMVIALLTLPAAVAGHFARRLWQMMALATVFCTAFAVAGLGLSYTLDLPCGPTIIVLAGAVYLVVTVGSRLVKGRSQ